MMDKSHAEIAHETLSKSEGRHKIVLRELWEGHVQGVCSQCQQEILILRSQLQSMDRYQLMEMVNQLIQELEDCD